MSVQDAVRTVVVPRQAGSPDDVHIAPVQAPAPSTPRGRAWTAEEREFAVVLWALFGVLSLVVVVGMVMAVDVWS